MTVSPLPPTMRAVVCHRYGGPEDLELRAVDRPEPGAGEVLVEVHATSINDWDWAMLRGEPHAYRLFMGLRRPKVRVFGVDVAGRVVAVGNGVTQLSVGDAVYGDLSDGGFGAFAEYVCAPEAALAKKSERIDMVQAAAMPHAAALAIQGFAEGGLRDGMRILVNGAGGGVGTLGAQIARQHEVELTGVDSDAKRDVMRQAGFDHVLDYTEVDFTRTGERYDLVLDTKTSRSVFDHARALAPGGNYVTVGGALPWLLHMLAVGPLVRRVTGKGFRLLALKPNGGLETVTRLCDAGALTAITSEPYALEQIPEALALFGAARHAGKIVVRIRD